MRPIRMTLAPTATDADGIAEAQTPSGAGNFTLDGALVAGGKATFQMPMLITFTSDGDDSGDTYTITGKDAEGAPLTVTQAGPNAETLSTTVAFKEVSQIATSGAGTGNITIGVAGTGYSKVMPLETHGEYIANGTSIAVDITGTIDFTVRMTYDNVFASSFTPTGATWYNITALAAKTADTASTIVDNPTALQVVVNSSAGGTAEVTVIQA